jgi:hypothetical protein
MDDLIASDKNKLTSNAKNLVELHQVGKIFPARRKGTDDVVALRETTQLWGHLVVVRPPCCL